MSTRPSVSHHMHKQIIESYAVQWQQFTDHIRDANATVKRADNAAKVTQHFPFGNHFSTVVWSENTCL